MPNHCRPSCWLLLALKVPSKLTLKVQSSGARQGQDCDSWTDLNSKHYCPWGKCVGWRLFLSRVGWVATRANGEVPNLQNSTESLGAQKNWNCKSLQSGGKLLTVGPCFLVFLQFKEKQGSIGSGPRYMICVTLFLHVVQVRKHRHARIAHVSRARVSRAFLACQCVFWQAQHAKKCDKIWYLWPLPKGQTFCYFCAEALQLL